MPTIRRMLHRPYKWGEAPTGRDRKRSHVDEFKTRLDAARIRRDLAASGSLGKSGRWTLHATVGVGESAFEVTATAIETPARLGGWRVWLICPNCKQRRVHLYPHARFGIGCRKCFRIGYADRRCGAMLRPAQPHCPSKAPPA